MLTELICLLVWAALPPFADRAYSYWIWPGMPAALITFICCCYVVATLAVWMRLFTHLRIIRHVALEDCESPPPLPSSIPDRCATTMRHELQRSADFRNKGLSVGLGKRNS
jgi:hypothetical protein